MYMWILMSRRLNLKECSYSEPCAFMKTDRVSLLTEGCFRKCIWREAIHEQKESLAEAILRMWL